MRALYPCRQFNLPPCHYRAKVSTVNARVIAATNLVNLAQDSVTAMIGGIARFNRQCLCPLRQISPRNKSSPMKLNVFVAMWLLAVTLISSFVRASELDIPGPKIGEKFPNTLAARDQAGNPQTVKSVMGARRSPRSLCAQPTGALSAWVS
jgi:hypothetical protein